MEATYEMKETAWRLYKMDAPALRLSKMAGKKHGGYPIWTKQLAAYAKWTR